ncbi:condensation domain-containing protein, partial [Pseudoalteromonas sp. MMG005]|uniref:condensation domain-containing protein n=1 Tax=Pseudoalteromonas sp. MMG005 TaxID=2822682 RepID=UPI0032B3AD77
MNIPLSYSQQRLWFIDNLQEGTTEYNMPIAFEVSGELDLPLLTRVFSTIIERHEVLRTVYREVQGETYQVVRAMSDVDFKITQVDLTHLTGETLTSEVSEQATRLTRQVFNLKQDVMLRVGYIQQTSESGVLLLNMHHIASDGWSMEVLLKEFFTLYHAYSEGLESGLAPLDIQYSDYAQWQRTYLEGGVLEKQLNYWEQQLADVPAEHTLPLDKARSNEKERKVAIVQGQLSAHIATQLQALAKAHQLTPFMLLHGALSLLLARHSNSSDIVIGTPVASRLQSETNPLIGFFANTLVLRANTNHDTLSA